MFRSSENQDSFYRISCSDWEYICLAESHYEASVKALKEMVKLKGKTQVSRPGQTVPFLQMAFRLPCKHPFRLLFPVECSEWLLWFLP